MIYKAINDNVFIIKVPKWEIGDVNIFDREEIEKFIKGIVVGILKKKRIRGLVFLNIYMDNWYGMVMEFESSDISFDDDEIDMKISFNIMDSFLYEFDYFMLKEMGITGQVVYYSDNKFYLCITNEIDEEDYLRILESSNIVYKDRDIMEKGIVINI